MGSDNMIQLRSVLQFKIMNMVQSILNSSLVKFLIFYQLQNTVVYPLILPSRITPSEIQIKDCYQQSITLPIVCTIFY